MAEVRGKFDEDFKQGGARIVRETGADRSPGAGASSPEPRPAQNSLRSDIVTSL